MNKNAELYDLLSSLTPAQQLQVSASIIVELPRAYRVEAVDNIAATLARTKLETEFAGADDCAVPATGLYADRVAEVKFRIAKALDRMEAGQARRKKQPTWELSMVLFWVGVALGYGWHMAAVAHDADNRRIMADRSRVAQEWTPKPGAPRRTLAHITPNSGSLGLTLAEKARLDKGELPWVK